MPAYSTLGWFDDPVLTTMLRWDDAALIGTGTPRLVLSPEPALTISNTVPPGARFRHGLFDKAAGSQG